MFLRLFWGLGTPVLYDLDPAIEYVQRPNQDLWRFGQHVLVNEYGMRSRSFPAHRTDPRELRVLVIGDSVVNGGVLTDHAKLATTLAESRLAAELGRPVIVGNISAGSWGPPNQLAYLERFGLFDADIVVLVLSSHDAGDVPGSQPPDPSQIPTERPWCAISELVTRYLPSRLPGSSTPPPTPGSQDRLDNPAGVAASMEALRAIVGKARATKADIVIVQHWELPEIEANEPRAGHDLIARASDEVNAPRVELGPIFRSSGAAACFRDHIHLSDVGQASLAGVIVDEVSRIARMRDSTNPDRPASD